MKLKRNMLIILFTLIVSAFLISGCGGQSEEDASTAGADNEDETVETETPESEVAESMEPVTLNFADFFPATHPAQAQLFTGWAEAINEATDGLVTIELYPGESLLSRDY